MVLILLATGVATRLADGLESIGFSVAVRPVASAIVGATPPDVGKTSIRWLHGKLEEEGIVTAPRAGIGPVFRDVSNSVHDKDRYCLSEALQRSEVGIASCLWCRVTFPKPIRQT